MMDAADFATKVLQRFPPFHWEDKREEGWLDDAIQELSIFDGPVLERAFRDLVRTRKKPGVPLIADLISACAEAKRWLAAEKDRKELPLGDQTAKKSHEWSPERIRLAYDLCRTEAGRKAAREGYAYRYWDHCRITSEAPAAKLCEQFKREADEHMQYVEDLHRAAAAFQPKPPASSGWIKLSDVSLDHYWAKVGESLLARERGKAAQILAGERG